MQIRAIVTAAMLFFAVASTAWAASIADRVSDGPAAGEIRESLRCLERADAATDEDVRLEWYHRGKKLAEAAVEKDERSSDAHFALFANWGRSVLLDGGLWSVRHLPEIRRHLDRALELDPKNSNALAAKGGMLFRLPRVLGGDPARAEAVLLEAAKLDPEAAGTRLELADYYVENGRPERARAHAEAALRIARENGKREQIGRAEALLGELGGGVVTASSR